ncbi:hypothetical protein KAU11_10180 [Candidatus Babeliales bacterium]|nr:hypothetical protein [Candidatus Babeliales bacterium]
MAETTKPAGNAKVPAPKKVQKDPHWPAKVPGTDFTLQKDDCLINLHPVRVSFKCPKGNRYRLPPGALCPKSLFRAWRSMPGVVEFKGDPSGKCVVVPLKSAH